VEQDLIDVGYTTIHHMMKHFDPVIIKIRRRKQGKRDQNARWAKMRLGWVMQLLARLGKHTFAPAAQENEHLELTNTPAYFD
jgi:hypothetical protein